jgi:hexosaminidase
MRSFAVSLKLVFAVLLVSSAASDPTYSFDDYTSTLPLPNGPTTNGTTMLFLPTKLIWTIKQTPAPKVLVAATQRYSDIIFAWGMPAGPPSSGATLTNVDISVDEADDSFLTLQLGMDESYTLDVPLNGTASIRAPTVWGALRALETLSQMIEYHPVGDRHQGEYTMAWAPWHVADSPRFPHRGIMLDTARHFFTVPGILRQFDAMAAAKMNTLHWHITDGNAVPIESKIFPELAKKGAYAESMIYSQEQVKTIVDYARHRGIRVVPEFDMPGHATAWALGAPAGVTVNCSHKDSQGNWFSMFDATSEAAYTFLDSFLGEMAALFPDKVVHLGGDEVQISCYNQSASVQAWLAKHPSVGLNDLVPMFSTRAAKIAAKHGKSSMNWEETFESIYLKANHSTDPNCHGYNNSKNETGPGGAKSCVAPAPRHQNVNASLPADAIVQAWGHAENVEMAQLSSTKFRSVSSMGYYFSAAAGDSTWEYVYNTDPACMYPGMCLYDLPVEAQKGFLGIDACIWSEHEDEFTIDRYWFLLSVLGERLWTHNATIAAHGDEYPPGQICKATNKTGCCHNPMTSYSPGCANYLNPSINSRMLKHRCRLMQRGFRPQNYETDILPFQDKWMQCGSWLPPKTGSCV